MYLLTTWVELGRILRKRNRCQVIVFRFMHVYLGFCNWSDLSGVRPVQLWQVSVTSLKDPRCFHKSYKRVYGTIDGDGQSFGFILNPEQCYCDRTTFIGTVTALVRLQNPFIAVPYCCSFRNTLGRAKKVAFGISVFLQSSWSWPWCSIPFTGHYKSACASCVQPIFKFILHTAILDILRARMNPVTRVRTGNKHLYKARADQDHGWAAQY